MLRLITLCIFSVILTGCASGTGPGAMTAACAAAGGAGGYYLGNESAASALAGALIGGVTCAVVESQVQKQRIQAGNNEGALIANLSALQQANTRLVQENRILVADIERFRQQSAQLRAAKMYNQAAAYRLTQQLVAQQRTTRQELASVNRTIARVDATLQRPGVSPSQARALMELRNTLMQRAALLDEIAGAQI